GGFGLRTARVFRVASFVPHFAMRLPARRSAPPSTPWQPSGLRHGSAPPPRLHRHVALVPRFTSRLRPTARSEVLGERIGNVFREAGACWLALPPPGAAGIKRCPRHSRRLTAASPCPSGSLSAV